jgi:hypothetical protein
LLSGFECIVSALTLLLSSDAATSGWPLAMTFLSARGLLDAVITSRFLLQILDFLLVCDFQVSDGFVKRIDHFVFLHHVSHCAL